MSHTKGVWHVDKFVYTNRQQPYTVARGNDDIGHDYVVIARVNQKDNASLIASAPDLLEVLKAALLTSEMEQQPHRKWHDTARAAIAKATETP